MLRGASSWTFTAARDVGEVEDVAFAILVLVAVKVGRGREMGANATAEVAKMAMDDAA